MNASLRNCPECGRIFGYVGRNMCPACLDKEEEDFQVVRKYVRDHPGHSVLEVSDDTGIDEEKILQFLRDGRLRSKGMEKVLECERCGKKISQGRFCDFCMGQIESNIRGAAPPSSKRPAAPEPPSRKKGERMHIKDE